MAGERSYDPTNKAEVFDTLRRQILAARLKRTLNAKQNLKSTPTVERLAQMNLPPIIEWPEQNNHVPAHRIAVSDQHPAGM
ncbi:hypothetical protein [Arthrobacter sp. BF1]|uniref:hypothetical protein n=1 Tax=Arthrobacter sp. BF1 TaxID=2821145 RepID=UPI001C4E4F81|nr:hypothetical protein [Arthrobacter sp. BF1]